MNVREIPLVGGFLSSVGGMLDLFIHGGDFVFSILGFLVVNMDMVIPIFGNLRRLAELVPWLPADVLEQLLIAALIVAFVVSTFKLITKYQES